MDHAGPDLVGRSGAEGSGQDIFEAGGEGFGGIRGEVGAGDTVLDNVDVAAAGGDEGRNAGGEGLDEGDGTGFVGGREGEPVGAAEDLGDLGGGAGESEGRLETVTQNGGAEFLGVLAGGGIGGNGSPDGGLDPGPKVFREAMDGVEEQVPLLPGNHIADADQLERAALEGGTGRDGCVEKAIRSAFGDDVDVAFGGLDLVVPGLIGGQEDRAEAAEAGGSSIESGALGVGVVGEERGDLLVGEPSGQGEGAAGVGVNDGVGFGAEESAQVGPGTPGGEEEAQVRPRLVEGVGRVSAAELRLADLEEG